jgi:hypothetical protein
MAGPGLPGPREPFTAAHLQRWPMGAERTELFDGQLYWPGDFDERDAMVARVQCGHNLVDHVILPKGMSVEPQPLPSRRECQDGRLLERDAGLAARVPA